MIINNKENENGQIIEKNNDIIQISFNIDEDIYIVNIYCSKDNSKIIFKLEKERIQTFYFYEKYDLKDFKQKNKQFFSKENIKDVFIILKQIIEKNSAKLEKNNIKINIIIFNKSEEIISFSLRKKIVSQKRFNQLLVEQIHNNKSKIKALKKQSVKYDKSLKNQNNNIDNINSSIDKINNNIQNIFEDIKIINNKINNLNEIKEKNGLNYENIKDNENKIRKINKNKNNIKENNMNLDEKKIDENNYYSNSFKNQIKKIEKNNRVIFFWNIIIMIFIIYLYFNCNQLKNDFIEEKKYTQKLFSFENKIKNLNLGINNKNLYNIKKNNYLNNKKKNKNINNKKRNQNNNIINKEFKNKKINENIIIYDDVDNNIKKEKNENEKIDNINKEQNKKDVIQNERFILENIEEINYFKNKIKEKTKNNIKDINFILKYKSDDLEYTDFYNNCKEISQNLILIKNNKGKKVGIISNNIIDILNNITINNNSKDNKNFIGYIFGQDQIDEINFNEIFKVYNVFISIYKEIYHFLIKNNHLNQSLENKLNSRENSNFVGKIDKIEIYQIKIRNNNS